MNYEKLAKLLELEDNRDIVTQIIQSVTNNTVTIEDMDQRDNEYEIFMSPSAGLTNKELNELQEFFNIIELGIYGDPDLPDDNVYFHMIVEFN